MACWHELFKHSLLIFVQGCIKPLFPQYRSSGGGIFMKRLFNIFLSLLIAASCIFSAGSSADQPVDMSGLKAAILVESEFPAGNT